MPETCGKMLPRLVLIFASILVFAAVHGCGGEDEEEQKFPAPGETDDFSLAYDVESGEFVLLKASDPLIRFPADAIQVGIVDEVDGEVNYDPWPLVTEDILYTPPAGLEWLSLVSVEADGGGATLEANETPVVFRLTYDKGLSATLMVEKAGEGSYKLLLMPDIQSGLGLAYYRLRPRVDGDEGFYGLGEYYDHVNHRGLIRAMQLEVAGEMETGYNDAHVPVPFVVGTTGWGLFVECPYPGVFDMASKSDDILEVTFGPGPGASDGLTFHLFAARHPLDLIKHYYDVTGYPSLPARWALGPWIWRDELNDYEPGRMQADVEDDLRTIRDLDLATTAYWIDRPYANGVNSFDFHTEQFPDPQGMIDLAQDMGFRMALWHTPYVSKDREKSERTLELREFAEESGYFPPEMGIITSKWGPPIDLTNPEAYDWWRELIREYVDMGIEGFKLDYGEDVLPGGFGVRSKWLFHDGSTERTMHALYQLFYHRVYAELFPEEGGFLLCRGGTYGDQKYVNVIWPGDIDARMWKGGEEIEDDGKIKKAVGGMPGAVVASQTLGVSGFPFFGSDTGGYLHAPPDKETFARWFEHSALSSVMQVGTNSNDVPWEYGDENGFDEEMLGWYRMYARLHLRLFPYEWTLAKDIARTGRPIQRSLGLAHPEIGLHPDFDYLFGDALLVAPVVERGARERTVVFPGGDWADWWDGSVYDGNQTATVSAPLSKLPLFLRRGGIVPLLRPTIDAIAPVAENYADSADSYGETPGVLYPRIFAGEASELVLFDGSVIRQEMTAGGIALFWKDGDEFRYGALFELLAFGSAAPSSISSDASALSAVESLDELEDAESGWFHDASGGGALYVKVKSGEHGVEVLF